MFVWLKHAVSLLLIQWRKNLTQMKHLCADCWCNKLVEVKWMSSIYNFTHKVCKLRDACTWLQHPEVAQSAQFQSTYECYWCEWFRFRMNNCNRQYLATKKRRNYEMSEWSFNLLIEPINYVQYDPTGLYNKAQLRTNPIMSICALNSLP